MRSAVLGKNHAVPAAAPQPRPEDLGIPKPSLLTVLLGGIGVPLVLLFYGISAIACRELTISSSNNQFAFYDGNAVAIGLAAMALAGLLHRQLFWDSFYDSTPAGARVKMICLLMLGVCAYYFCFQVSEGFY